MMRRIFLALTLLLGASVAWGGGPVTPPTPIATTSVTGKVKPDGTTITVTGDGTISTAGSSSGTVASGTAGQIAEYGSTGTTVRGATVSGAISYTVGGAVALTASAFANPTGTVGPTATNGSATTAMRSDGAPAINLTSTYPWTGPHSFSQTTSFIGSTVKIGDAGGGYSVISFTGGLTTTTDTGIAGAGDNNLYLGAKSGSNVQLRVNGTPVLIAIGDVVEVDVPFRFGSDTAISRVSTGILALGNGTAGTTGSGLLLQNVVVAKTGNYTVLTTDTNKHFDNTGAGGEVDFTLPAAASGLQYCFAVTAAQTLKVIANTGDKIAIGTSNSAASGNISNNAVYGSVCLEAHGTGQWFATSHEGTWTVT